MAAPTKDVPPPIIPPESTTTSVNSAWWGMSGLFKITQGFGVLEDLIINGVHIHQPHSGIDIGMPVGTPLSTPVHAKVTGAGTDKYGNKFVQLLLDNGLTVLLLHLDSVAVSTGQDLSPGAPLGKSGMSGLATGPHLHFEVDSGGKPIDPWTVLHTNITSADSTKSPVPSGNPLDSIASSLSGIGDFVSHLAYTPHDPCSPPDNEAPWYKIADAIACKRNWYKVGFITVGVVLIGFGLFLYFFKEEVHAAEEGVGTVAGAAAKAA
jgi:hypothetical protein